MSAVAPFIVLSLPRSRSAWMSSFLAYDGTRVGHDIAISCKTVEEFVGHFKVAIDGTCETGAVLGWKLIRQMLPKARIVVVKRPVVEIVHSLAQFGLYPGTEEMQKRADMLDLVSALPGTLTANFGELSDPMVAKSIFEFCLERPFDPDWWVRMDRLNIQVDMRLTIARLQANHENLEALKQDIKDRQAKMTATECRMLN